MHHVDKHTVRRLQRSLLFFSFVSTLMTHNGKTCHEEIPLRLKPYFHYSTTRTPASAALHTKNIVNEGITEVNYL